LVGEEQPSRQTLPVLSTVELHSCIAAQFRIVELSRGTQIADFEPEGHFTALNSRTEATPLQVNRGSTVGGE